MSQSITKYLRKEMPTLGGSDNASDFNIGGVLDGDKPHLYKGLYYTGGYAGKVIHNSGAMTFRIIPEGNVTTVLSKLRETGDTLAEQLEQSEGCVWQWVDYFIDSYWNADQGSWNAGLSKWASTVLPGGGGLCRLYLDVLGDWFEDFRPPKMKITLDVEWQIDSLKLLDVDDNIIGEASDFSSPVTVDLDFSGCGDIARLEIEQLDSEFNVSNIQFWECVETGASWDDYTNVVYWNVGPWGSWNAWGWYDSEVYLPVPSFCQRIWLSPDGGWEVGYRPTKLRITSPDAIYLNCGVYDDYQAVNPWANQIGSNNQNFVPAGGTLTIDLDFTGCGDIVEVRIAGSGAAGCGSGFGSEYTITSLEFTED